MDALNEIDALSNYIRQLKDQTPTAVPKTGGFSQTTTSEAASIATGWRDWLNEVADTVQFVVPGETYWHKRAETLRDKTIDDRAGARDVGQEAIRMLDATERYMRLRKRDAITDDFRRSVEIAVKDGYFESWPFRMLLGAFGVLTALLFGGTVYSTWHVEGIQKQAEQAQQSIRDKSSLFEKQLSDAAKEIEDKRLDIDGTIRKAVEANNSEIGKIVEQSRSDASALISQTKELLRQTQTDLIGRMNDELHNQLREATAKESDYLRSESQKIGDSWREADRKLDGHLAMASKLVDAAKDTAISRLSSRGAEVDDQKAAVLASIELAKTTATNKLATYQAEVEGKRDEATRAFANQADNLSSAITDARARINTEIEKLPEEFKRTATVLKSIDDALGKYKLNIAKVVQRLDYDSSGGSLALVVDVLGLSFWLMIGSLAISLATLLFVVALLFRNYKSKPPKSANREHPTLAEL
jgi:hypothetical protein